MTFGLHRRLTVDSGFTAADMRQCPTAIDVTTDGGSVGGITNIDINIPADESTVTTTKDITADGSVALENIDRRAAKNGCEVATAIDGALDSGHIVRMIDIADNHHRIGRNNGIHIGTTLTTAENITIGGSRRGFRDSTPQDFHLGSDTIVGRIDMYGIVDSDIVVLSTLCGSIGSEVATTIDIMNREITVILVIVHDNGNLAFDSAIVVAATEDTIDGTALQIDGHIATIADRVAMSLRIVGGVETLDIGGDTCHTLSAAEHIAYGAALDDKGDVAIEVGSLARRIDVTVFGSATAVDDDGLTADVSHCRLTTGIFINNRCAFS